MRRLDKIKPTGRGLAQALPEKVGGGAVYFPLVGNSLVVYEEFPGTAIDTDDWADASTNGTGGAAGVTFASSFAVLDTSTGTSGTVIQRIRSAHSGSAHLYNVPFRAIFWARVSTTAGAGVAPTSLLGGVESTSSPLAVTLAAYSTDDLHFAKFFLDLSTAGSSSLAGPVVNVKTQHGTTGANFINSAAHNIFSTAADVNHTVTSLIGYCLEITHRGASFGMIHDRNATQAPLLLSHFGNAVPSMTANYYLDARLIADGTAGFSQTDGVQLEIDSIVVEQMAPSVQPMVVAQEGIANNGGVRSLFTAQAMPSGNLVTAGAGMFIGVGCSSTATVGADLYLGVYDASAAGSAVYDYTALPSSAARLIWFHPVQTLNSAGIDLAPTQANPPCPIPFYRGLVVGSCDVDGNAAGSTAFNCITVFNSQR